MEHSAATTKRNALLAAFGCAVGYLLGGKLLALLPVPALLPERLLSFLHHCAAAPIAEELVFRGAIQRFAKPLGRAALRWGRCGNAPAKYGWARFCIH